MATSYESIAILAEQQVSGTDGGTFTAGSRVTRTLNTEIYDGDNIVTLSSNQFTLQAGTYEVEAWLPAYQSNRNKAWLYNVTDAGDEKIGLSNYSKSAAYGLACPLRGSFTIASAKAFELQHRCERTEANFGLGVDTQWGTEQYATLIIRKVATNDVGDSWAMVSDQKASTTDGGSISAGAWVTHDLNTEDFDPDNIVTLFSNQFTLQAGTYEILAFSRAYDCNRAQSRIYNDSDASEEFVGVNEFAYATGNGECLLVSVGVVTLASAKNLELQHRAQTASSQGFGLSADFDTEIYANVLIRKLP